MNIIQEMNDLAWQEILNIPTVGSLDHYPNKFDTVSCWLYQPYGYWGFSKGIADRMLRVGRFVLRDRKELGGYCEYI